MYKQRCCGVTEDNFLLLLRLCKRLFADTMKAYMNKIFKAYSKQGVFLAVLPVLFVLFFATQGITHSVLGGAFFILYMAVSGFLLWKNFFYVYTDSEEMVVGVGLGVFVSFFWFVFIVSLAIFLGKFSSFTLMLSIILHASSICCAVWLGSRGNLGKELVPKENYFGIRFGGLSVLHLVAAFYLFFSGISLYLLILSRSNGSLVSPWQTISKWYIYFFCLATLFLSILLFATPLRYKNVLLILCVIHSLLFHSYMPVSHTLFYGADQWRHAANEMSIIHGTPFVSVGTRERVSFVQQLDLGRLAYSQLWAASIAIATFFSTDIIIVNAWLVPLLWGCFFPLLLWFVGKKIGWQERKIFLFIFLSFLPFAWAVAGSFTLPNNIGFLWFLFMFGLLLCRLKDPRSHKILGALCFTFVVSLTGYSLYILIFGMLWFFVEVLLRLKTTSLFSTLWVWLGVITVGSLCIPFVEILARYSSFNLHHAWISSAKQFVGNITGWYLALGPPPHDISTGNLILNQVPLQAFVANFFTQSRYWLVVCMLIFIVLLVCGCIKLFQKKDILSMFIVCSAGSMTCSYIIGRYVLEGQQLLSRRLEPVVVFFWIILCVEGIFYFRHIILKKCTTKVVLLVSSIGVLLLSCFISASYSLGPDERVVSMNEYRAMEFVWSGDNVGVEHCVVGETLPLLALEQISSKQIVGGGFPINQYFAQPEREKFLKKLSQNADQQTWIEALDLTKTNTCFLVVNKKDLKYNEFVNKHLNDVKLFGEMVVWKYVGVSQSLKQ